MPSPSSPSRYPVEFMEAFEHARKAGTFFIPSLHPHALKTQLWGFARALRSHGKADLADAVQVCPVTGGVELRHRSTTPAAREVAAALRSLPSSEEADDILKRLP